MIGGKVLAVLLVAIAVTGCDAGSSDDVVKEKPLFWYTCNGKVIGDTLTLEQIGHGDPEDTLLGGLFFHAFGEDHTISYVTSDNHAAVDGGADYFLLDSLGIIYGHSTTWRGYSRLRSTNDSIDQLIGIALDNILSRRHEFSHCGCLRKAGKTIKFLEPAVD